MADPKLSTAQKRVMKWLGRGWEAFPGCGVTVLVNGQRICNVDTITALIRIGLVEKTETPSWKATQEGRELTGRLCL